MIKVCGIYKITNKINGKCYIGQSNDIHRRWKQELAPNAKLNPHLARAFEKYGIDNFEFEIIEECQREQLNQIVIYCYETNKYYLSIGKAAKELGICKDSIRHVINGHDKHALNYRFCKISDNINEFIESCQHVDIYLKEHNITLKQYYTRLGKTNKKQVLCIETNQIFVSASEAARQMNLNKHCIIWCCNGKYKHAHNYHFKYIEK